ncbi:MAG: transcriptional regulator [Planctomycetota bacterium]
MAKSFDELVRRTTSKRVRERGEARARELMSAMLLEEVRACSGKSAKVVLEAFGGVKQRVSKLKRETDLPISTLKRIVAALGGELDVIARFPNGTVRVDGFDGDRKVRPSRRSTKTADVELV